VTRSPFFYTFADDPLDVARRVASKAHAQGKQVMIHAPDPATADAIDRLLWTHRLWASSPIAAIPMLSPGKPRFSSAPMQMHSSRRMS
jgi:DNA polymerase III, chi subunit